MEEEARERITTMLWKTRKEGAKRRTHAKTPPNRDLSVFSIQHPGSPWFTRVSETDTALHSPDDSLKPWHSCVSDNVPLQSPRARTTVLTDPVGNTKGGLAESGQSHRERLSNN